MPYLRTLLKEYKFGRQHASLKTSEESDRLRALERATVASHGHLRDDHKWLEGPLSTWSGRSRGTYPSSAASSGTARKKKVLVLGSGMVAGPAIDEIASHDDTELVVGKCFDHSYERTSSLLLPALASNSLAEAERLTAAHINASPRLIDMANQEEVARLVGEADVVVR